MSDWFLVELSRAIATTVGTTMGLMFAVWWTQRRNNK